MRRSATSEDQTLVPGLLVGKDRYLYRSLDKFGNTVDFLLTKQSDAPQKHQDLHAWISAKVSKQSYR
ncbi:MAG: hypothetical protein QNL61_00005, partial [Crocinitomicaceae bacterium]